LFASEALVERAVERLHDWYRSVPTNKSRHVYSILPTKLAGAMPGAQIAYREEDDRRFLDRFFRYRDGDDPYFDPFSRGWLKAGYAHSNAATFRKGTFRDSWQACKWDGEHLQLAIGYHLTVEERMLTKGGKVSRIPALPLAVWFFKRPTAEWPDDHELHAHGMPEDPADLIELFRTAFHFSSDPGWDALFDPGVATLPEYSK
jgi:hypothetical protein